LEYQGGCRFWAQDIYSSFKIQVRVDAYVNEKLIKSQDFEGTGKIEGHFRDDAQLPKLPN
jgi:hypothetical protein